MENEKFQKKYRTSEISKENFQFESNEEWTEESPLIISVTDEQFPQVDSL